MYICNDPICDPICDFCWYCIHGEYGEPTACEFNDNNYEDGLGYCNQFICRLHEPNPHDNKKTQQNKAVL